MFHRRYRIQVVVRLAAAFAAGLLCAYLAAATRLYEAALLAGLLCAYLVVRLVRYTEKTVVDLTHFLEGIRYGDFTRHFGGERRGPLFEQLGAAFEAVLAEFQRVRTEREEQVRYLQSIVQHIGVALLVYRADGRIELMNPAAKRLLEAGRRPHVGALAAFSEPLAQALLRLRAGEQALVRVTRDAQTYQLSISASQFVLRGETYTIASLQDIRNELEEQEMAAWQQLTRVLTHEIMNSVAPLSSLAATATHLLEKEHPAHEGDPDVYDDIREALDVIRRRSTALVGFVDAYRRFTRIPVPAYQLVPVRTLFGHVARLMEAQAQRQGVALRTSVDPEGLTLTADPDLIEQVLINLVRNALEAVGERPDGYVALRASVDRRGIPVLQVADNGPGIAPEVQERIFVPFFTTKESGSGIGLSLSRRILRLHGGTIGVRSAPGEETVFSLLF